MISHELISHAPDLLSIAPFLLAFSFKIRKKIYERDHVCTICGGTNHLEAAHIDHNKSNPRYDDESNGRLLCLPDHIKDHINREGRNGLTVAQNRWAINIMLEKLKGKSNQQSSD